MPLLEARESTLHVCMRAAYSPQVLSPCMSLNEVPDFRGRLVEKQNCGCSMEAGGATVPLQRSAPVSRNRTVRQYASVSGIEPASCIGWARSSLDARGELERPSALKSTNRESSTLVRPS